MTLDAESVAAVAGSVGAGALAWRFLVSKAFRTAEKTEDAISAKLDTVLATLHELQTEVRADRERAAAVQSAVIEVKDRINGVSANHGPRIGDLEQRWAALDARVVMLEARRKR